MRLFLFSENTITTIKKLEGALPVRLEVFAVVLLEKIVIHLTDKITRSSRGAYPTQPTGITIGQVSMAE